MARGVPQQAISLEVWRLAIDDENKASNIT